MAVTANLFRQVMANVLGSTSAGNAPNVDWLSDTIKVMLATNAYTPNLDTHQFKSSVTNEITGTGYTAGGATLTSPTLTYTAANSWATQWAASTAYTVGQIVRPTVGNGHLYRAIVAGTSAASQPTWPLVSGQTVTDGGVTWAEIGGGIVQADAADASWASSTLTARYAIVYDNTPASDATRPLIALIDFGADVSTTNGTFAITWDVLGIVVIPIA